MKVSSDHKEIKKVIQKHHPRCKGNSVWAQVHELNGKDLSFRDGQKVAELQDGFGQWDVLISHTPEIMKSSHGQSDYRLHLELVKSTEQDELERWLESLEANQLNPDKA